MKRFNLHEALQKRKYHHGLIATYTFGPRFFEDYALEKFGALQDNGNLSVLLDEGVLNQLLHGENQTRDVFPQKANVRYLLHPVRVAGRFHPKVYLFARRDRGLLVVGSANCTQNGICSNAEMVGVFEFIPGESEECQPLFQQAFSFFHELSLRWPSTQLTSNLAALVDDAPWVAEVREEPADHLPTFAHNLDRPLLDQIAGEAGEGPISHLSVVSRFFDDHPHLLDRIEERYGQTGDTQLYTQNGITTLTGKWLDHPAAAEGRLGIQICRYGDEEDAQPLHAKAMLLERESGSVFAFGSANFTTPALLRDVSRGNAETMLIYRGLSSKEIDPKEFFDPGGSAVPLRSAADLVTDVREKAEEVRETPDFELRLVEANLLEDRLQLHLRDDTVLEEKKHLCALTSPKRRTQLVTLTAKSDGTLEAQVPAKLVGQMKADATLVHLARRTEDDMTAESNSVLVANIQDLKTGRSVRNERRFQEAKQSPERFAAVLQDLTLNADEETLMRFLATFNLDLDQKLRVFRPSQRKSREVGPEKYEEMRALGERNIRIFLSVHEAVLGFVDRHTRRLHKHIDQGTAAGIPNFMQILLTVANLLRSEIERAIAGLSSEQGVTLNRDEWFSVRERLDDYYKRLDKLLGITVEDYLAVMLEAYDLEAVREGFAPDLEELQKLYEDILATRDRIDGACQSNVRVKIPAKGDIPPAYFKSVLHPQKWKGYAERVEKLSASLAEGISV